MEVMKQNTHESTHVRHYEFIDSFIFVPIDKRNLDDTCEFMDELLHQPLLGFTLLIFHASGDKVVAHLKNILEDQNKKL